jgi:hypothetical protein
LNLKIDTPYGQILGELRAITPPTWVKTAPGQQQQDINLRNRALSAFEAHLKGNTTEAAETGLNVAHLLSALRDLIQRIQLAEQDDITCYEDLLYARLNALCRNMEENLELNGGCYQGYAGRLWRNMMELLIYAVENPQQFPVYE